jgi:hypothetical protein
MIEKFFFCFGVLSFSYMFSSLGRWLLARYRDHREAVKRRQGITAFEQKISTAHADGLQKIYNCKHKTVNVHKGEPSIGDYFICAGCGIHLNSTEGASYIFYVD